VCKTLKLICDLISKIVSGSKKPQSPCYFPCSQGIRGKEWED
jgi:hypothetical protein